MHQCRLSSNNCRGIFDICTCNNNLQSILHNMNSHIMIVQSITLIRAVSETWNCVVHSIFVHFHIYSSDSTNQWLSSLISCFTSDLYFPDDVKSRITSQLNTIRLSPIIRYQLYPSLTNRAPFSVHCSLLLPSGHRCPPLPILPPSTLRTTFLSPPLPSLKYRSTPSLPNSKEDDDDDSHAGGNTCAGNLVRNFWGSISYNPHGLFHCPGSSTLPDSNGLVTLWWCWIVK